MFLEIITTEKVFFKGQVDIVRVPGTKGSFAMMHNHTPIISSLDIGLIKVTQDLNERFFELLDPAVVEQHDDRIIILAERIQETYPLLVR
jgi:F-type H+-transporting ATPase subunit epsilon